MRIAFYAPMKPPGHPIPSGDRRIARLFMQALGQGAHDVQVVSEFRSWQAEADPDLQKSLRQEGEAEAARIAAAVGGGDLARPDLFFTYHLYYKAPDWIGPKVASTLSIPYVVSEASLAYKRAGGPWDVGHRGVLQALESASAIVNLNPLDAECLPEPEKIHNLHPFLDTAPYRAAAAGRERHRAQLSRDLQIDPESPWLLSVAMLRPGDKLASYRLLAEALRDLGDAPWTLLIAGGGEALGEVRAAFSAFPDECIRFLGERSEESLYPLYAACDLFVWPAIREAFGMAILEAQASGLPVIAGAQPGVARIVEHRETGLLSPEGDVRAFAALLRALLQAPAERRRMAANAIRKSQANHDIASAAAQLDSILQGLRGAHA